MNALDPNGGTMLIPHPVSETAALLAVIERAARDPSVDLEKLERLLSLREQMQEREAKRAFDDAMTDAQMAMRPVATDASNPQTKSRYASLAALDRALRPIYTQHGFALSFNTENASADAVTVLCYVARGGHTRTYSIVMPADGKGAKGGDVMTRTHATGSAVTYGRRYLLLMIFNIAVGDDDGNSSGGGDGEFITPTQAANLKKLIEDTGGNVEKFCAFAKVESLSNIYANRFEAAAATVVRAADQRKAAKQ